MNLQQKLDVLVGMRELLSDPDHWTKGQYAGKRKSMYHGLVEALPMNSDRADCFCLVGAFCKVAADKGIIQLGYSGWDTAWGIRSDLVELEQCVINTFGNNRGDAIDTITGFNDSGDTEHKDVLAALDCAIDNLKATVEQ